jgi:hypothetical protein
MQLALRLNEQGEAEPVSLNTHISRQDANISVAATTKGITLRVPGKDGAESVYNFDPDRNALVSDKGEKMVPGTREESELRLISKEVSIYWRQVSKSKFRLGNHSISIQKPGIRAGTTVFRRSEDKTSASSNPLSTP